MKKILTAVALIALATTAYAGSNPGTGVFGSPHDMNTVTGLQADVQGRVCAFCHTPHHAVDLAGQYNPLWSHTPTALSNVIAYASPTFDGANAVGAPITDPLIGPSRLCMSCHDGAIAPDQHYGSANFTTGGRFASDAFNYIGAKNIAVGVGGDFGNDHPIGFDINLSVIGDGMGVGGTETGTNGLRGGAALLTQTWLGNTTAPARTIGQGTFKVDTANYMTCATCHDVHNKDNAINVAGDAAHTDTMNLNYFVYAPQSGSQLCLSCHAK